MLERGRRAELADREKERRVGGRMKDKERVPDWDWNTHISFSGIVALISQLYST